MNISVESVINIIRENLNDRYKRGFPVVKELIQNADDAGATCLEFGIFPAVPGAHHPLLQGSALVVVNNGQFTEKNARAINSIGLSSKTSDHGSIGKFGLGLKSIFHFCEAFFYLSNRSDELCLVNPWAQSLNGNEVDAIHQDWNALARNDHQQLKLHLREIIPAGDYLCLWIPLRKRRHQNRNAPITDFYPGDEQLSVNLLLDVEGRDGSQLAYQCAALMPFLHHLQQIQYWESSAQGNMKPVFRVDVEIGAHRRRHITTLKPGHEEHLSGKIDVSAAGNSRKESLQFIGSERMSPSHHLATLKASPYWPKHNVTDSETFELLCVEDKAEPHSAICFGCYPSLGAQPRLQVDHAVFLPIGEPTTLDLSAGKRDFFLTLHGYYFVDAGRSRIEGLDSDGSTSGVDDNRTLREAWNSSLFTDGTLPLVLPTLGRFVQQAELSVVETTELTTAIQKTTLYKEMRFQNALCSDHQWIYVVRAGVQQWRLVSSRERILNIPRPPATEPDRPFAVMPKLEHICHLTYSDAPRLNSTNTETKWHPEDLQAVLDLDVSKVFLSSTYLNYLVDFLEQARPDQTIAKHLNGLGRAAMYLVGPAKLRKHRKVFNRFCALLPQGQRVSFSNLESEVGDLILHALNEASDDVLLLPKDLDSDQGSVQASLSTKQALHLLRTVQELTSSISAKPSFHEMLREVVLQIFANTSDPARLRRECWDLRIVPVERILGQGAQRSTVLITLEELANLKQRGMLFRYASPPTPYGLSDIFADALANKKVTLIHTELAKALDMTDLSACDAVGCISALYKASKLSAIDKRLPLLRELLKADIQSGHSQAVSVLRYLLHGDTEHFTSNESLLVVGESDPLWATFVKQAVSIQPALHWRLLPLEAESLLAPEKRILLRIQSLGSSGGLDILGKLSDKDLSRLDFSSLDREKIFLAIDNPRILRYLRIHIDHKGERIALDTEHIYLQDDYALPPVLTADIVLLRQERNENVLKRYQEMGIPIWDATRALEILLKKDDPQQHWREILDALDALTRQPEEALHKLLRTTAWLPTKSLNARAPDDVIYIEGMQDDIARVLAHTEAPFVDVPSLHPDLSAHPAWQKLQKWVFPQKADAIAILGSALELSSNYFVGLIETESIVPDLQNAFFDLWKADTDQSLMPVAPVLQQVAKHVSLREANEIRQRLQKSIPLERLLKILEYLTERHEEEQVKWRAGTLAWFNAYLAGCAKHESFPTQILPQIRLLNQRGEWKPTQQLCSGYLGIDPNDLLDDVQAKCLRIHDEQERIHTEQLQPDTLSTDVMGPKTDGSAFRNTAVVITDYFKPWEAVIEPELIGGFLCLLGDDDDILELAERYLGNRHVYETRQLLDWHPLQGGAAGHNVSGFGEGIHEVMRYQRFVVKVIETSEGTYSVTSLPGDQFLARLTTGDDMENLIVHREQHQAVAERQEDFQINRLCMRRVNVEHLSARRLASLLAQMTQFVLNKFYFQNPSNIEEYWQELQQSDQLDIESAQAWILDSLPHYFPQLGLNTDPDIGPLIRQATEDRTRYIEAKRSSEVRTRKETSSTLDQQSNDLGEKLRELLEDTSVQDRIVASLRRKITQEYQYRPASILFELFQNADDAAVELTSFHGSNVPRLEVHQTVSVQINKETLDFAHWGRAINQSPGISPSERKHSFGSDLQKMLQMRVSDKNNDGTASLTGKFGLGFKSVYLLCKRPQIISGRLAFEIVGSLYPCRIYENRETLEQLRKTLTAGRQERDTGTVYHLPIDADVPASIAAETVDAFTTLIHVAVVFAKQIRRCELSRDGRKRIEVGWFPRSIGSRTLWSIGDIQPVEDTQPPLKGLLLQSSEGSLLFTLNARGFQPLASRIPTIWVTAPTLEKYEIGFAVNGNFVLDIGRAQLARENSENESLAERISEELSIALQQLAELAQDWERFCQALALAQNTNPYEFWNSLFSVMVKPLSESSDAEGFHLLQRMVGRADAGYAKFVEQNLVLPTGLQGEFRVLTSLQKARYATHGILQEKIEAVQTWKSFMRQIQPGTLLHASVMKVLEAVLSPPPNIERLTLLKVIRWEINGSYKIEPETAQVLGALVTPAFMSDLQRYSYPEYQELREFCQHLEFRNESGQFNSANNMLINREDVAQDRSEVDEVLRSRFCPPGLLLDKTYEKDAIAFFRVCRDRLFAGVETLVQWAFDAKTDEQKESVIRYALQGELRDRFILELKRSERFPRSWLNDLAVDHPLLIELDLPVRKHFLYQLGLQSDIQHVPAPVPRLDTTATLLKIYDWWMDERDTYLDKYERQVYPTGSPPSKEDLEIDATNFRHAWLTLFVLGATHTVGRMTSEQHRTFLERCQEKGWFDTFVNKNAEADQWMEVLDEYLEDDKIGPVDFQYWHLIGKQFVSIYQLARYLESYAEAFVSLNRASSHAAMQDFLNVRTSALFQGSGLDAPPITKTLGMGACFVVRELVRLGIVTSPYAYTHCYVPVQRVRDRFVELGCNFPEKPSVDFSGEIHNFLHSHLGEDKATFGNAFDIPFQIIHREWGRIPEDFLVYQ